MGKHLLRALLEVEGGSVAQVSFGGSGETLSFDPDSLHGIDVLIHAGFFTPKERGQSADVVGCSSNIEFTQCLTHLPLADLRRVIYVSSLDVYAATSDVLTEASTVDPFSLYGASKLFSKSLLRAFCGSRGIEFSILRLGQLYGPGESAYRKLIPSTFESVMSGWQPVIFGSGRSLGSYLYVSDAASAIVNAAKLDIVLPIVNVAGGEPVSVIELVSLITEVCGSDLECMYARTEMPDRHVVADNRLMTSYLLERETPLRRGLELEFESLRASRCRE